MADSAEIWLLPRGWVRGSVGKSAEGRGIRQGLWAQGRTPPTLAQAMWFYLALARLRWVGLAGQPGLGSDWTNIFLCWDERERVRRRKSGGYQGEVVREGDKMGRSRVGTDWDRQSKEVGGSQKEMVRVRQRKVRGHGQKSVGIR